MTKASTIAANHGIAANEQLLANNFAPCGNDRAKGLFAAAMRVVQRFADPKKRNAAKRLSAVTGHGSRVCQQYLAGDRTGGFGVAVDLVFSEMGLAVLAALAEERRARGEHVPQFIDDLPLLSAVAGALRRQNFNAAEREALKRLE